MNNKLIPVETFEQLMKFAEMASKSDLVPKDFKGNPGNILIAWEMGAEIGLSRMQALQSIAVINGRPSVWGDAIPALAQGHPDYEWHREYYDEEKQAAVCTVKRKGAPEHTYQFSMSDVVAGGYDKKPGPWQTERKRMMQMRARRAFRDQFADALKGVYIAEEAQDIQPSEQVPVTIIERPKTSQVDALKALISGDIETETETERLTAGMQSSSRSLKKAEWDYIQACLDDVGISKEDLFHEFGVKGGSQLKLSQMDEISNWVSLEVDKRSSME
jgi:hypothetical protein